MDGANKHQICTRADNCNSPAVIKTGSKHSMPQTNVTYVGIMCKVNVRVAEWRRPTVGPFGQ